MFHWMPYVMVRVALFFTAGILLAIYQPELLEEQVLWVALAVLLALYGLVVMFVPAKSAKVVSGVFGLGFIFVSGFQVVLLRTDSRLPNHFLNLDRPVEYYEAVVTKYPEQKEKSWKIEADIRKVRTDGRWQEQTGKVLLYFHRHSFEKPFAYGDVLLISGAPQELSPPANPGEFDYKRFLTFRKIYHQHFVKKERVHWLGSEPPNPFTQLSIEARVWADSVIQAVVPGEREGAIASALVLGVVDGLDNELLQAYAATGAMHVLAVSGLHVGIIYWIILLLLKPLNKASSGKWIVAVVSVFILWSYAFVTGLSPSVLRAVTMFTFVALAHPWKQTPNIYNTLAASAFLLLLYEPYLVMSVGFQLSFIAVVGIVYIQPLIYRWWEPSGWLWDQVWKITCVSVAAQIATFSLGLLYFHQFPNYFLFSNLFVIPGSFVVLVAGLALLALYFFSPVAALIGMLLEGTIKLMNSLVFAVEALPYSLLENIYISTFQCWTLMGLVFGLLLLFTHRRFIFLPVATLFALLFAADEWYQTNENIDLRKLVVYRVAGHSAIDLIDRGHSFFLTDSVLRSDEERIRFHIRPNRLRSGVAIVSGSFTSNEAFAGFSILTWRGQRLLQIESAASKFPEEVAVDWLVISNNSVRSLASLKDKIHFQQIILDGSNSSFVSSMLLEEGRKLNWPVHSVLHEGAFERQL